MDIMEVMEDEATWWPMPRFSAKHESRRGQVVIGAEEIKKIWRVRRSIPITKRMIESMFGDVYYYIPVGLRYIQGYWSV